MVWDTGAPVAADVIFRLHHAQTIANACPAMFAPVSPDSETPQDARARIAMRMPVQLAPTRESRRTL